MQSINHSDLNDLPDKQSEEHLQRLSLLAQMAIKSPHKLRRFLRRWEKDESEIEDIISFSLLNAVRNIQSYAATSNIETWFFGICKNIARQHVASKIHSTKYIHYINDFNEVGDALLHDTTPALDEEFIYKENLQKLTDQLARLPKDQQALFQAIYVEGKSYTDVSCQLDIPLGTVKSRVNRLRLSLIHLSRLRSL